MTRPLTARLREGAPGCLLLSVGLALLPVVACGPRPLPEDPPLYVDDPAAGRERGDEGAPRPATLEEPAPPAATIATGTIAHAELVAVLEAGPAVFLGKIAPEPSFVGGRFAGWRVGRVPRGTGGFGGVDLKPGDIVLKVNGKTCERPEGFQELWDALRFADRLIIEVDRDGKAHRLDFAIEHGASASPPASARTPEPTPAATDPAPAKKKPRRKR